MKISPEHKRSAIRYWERRRLIYNAALIVPALVGYGFADMHHWIGAPPRPDYIFLSVLFVASAIGANLCYSAAYALEFHFERYPSFSRWVHRRRTVVFVGGVLFAMLLAHAGGRNIALAEWFWSFDHAHP